LKNLDERLKYETGIPCHVSENALINVVLGSALALEEIDILKVLTVSR
jgi:actin-like ATPase involved in cell morphogenesis